jgi:SAM-dependent methyltransferase
MKKIVKFFKFAAGYLGFKFSDMTATFKGLGWYFKDLSSFRKAIKTQGNTEWPLMIYPIFKDKSDLSGSARGQYFFQDLYVANLIHKNNPLRHIDIGSRIDGFVAHVASFRKVEVMDIRPLTDELQNINFLQADLMQEDPDFFECTDSLSCLHTIEHFGLGRYNDPIDVDGHLKGLESMYKMLKQGGLFYFSTQIGPQKVAFNAHRIFSIKTLLNIFEGKYEILGFSYINDDDKLIVDAELTEEAIQSNFGCKLGCGIFVLRKV